MIEQLRSEGSIEDAILKLYRGLAQGPGKGRDVVGVALVLYVTSDPPSTEPASITSTEVVCGFAGPAARRENVPSLTRAAAEALANMSAEQFRVVDAQKAAGPGGTA